MGGPSSLRFSEYPNALGQVIALAEETHCFPHCHLVRPSLA